MALLLHSFFISSFVNAKMGDAKNRFKMSKDIMLIFIGRPHWLSINYTEFFQDSAYLTIILDAYFLNIEVNMMSIKIFLIFVFILLMSGCYTTNSYRSYYAYPDSIKYSNSYHHYYHPRYRHKKFRSFYGFKYYRGHFYRPRPYYCR